jgi:hypothetical protein
MPVPHVPSPPPTYDASAVAVIASIERTVQQLHPDRQGEIIAILNAITCHVEEGQGDPGVLRHLTDALLTMVAIVRLDARAVTLITRKLDKLRDRVGRARS